MSNGGVKLADFVRDLNLEVLHRGEDFDTVKLTVADTNRPGFQFLHLYEYFSPSRLQIMGLAETDYLSKLKTSEERYGCFQGIFSMGIPAIIICRSLEPVAEMMECARDYKRTVLRSKEATVECISHSIEYLRHALAPSITRHGVLLDIHGEGVMLTGDSGVGKSETAIELIMRGHRLVADDAVELRHISGQLIGTAPEIIRHYIELRGIGVIDVRQLFGLRAIKPETQLDLVVHFEPWDHTKMYDRLGIEDHYTDILGVQIPIVTVPVRPGRNLATIVEVAAMNVRQRKSGYNAALELARQVDMRAEGGHGKIE